MAPPSNSPQGSPKIPPKSARSIEPVDRRNQIQPGMLLESKDLYRSGPYEKWSVRSPDDLGDDSKDPDNSAKFALIVKHETNQEDNALILHSVQVQSPLIRTVLGPVFAGYPGINTNLRNLRFHAPFREFFYRWQEFVKASTESKIDETSAAHFRLLFDIISSEIKPHIEEVKDLLLNGCISFEYLWAIFEPGMDVYSVIENQQRIFRLRKAEYVSRPDHPRIFCINGQYIDTNGSAFGYASTSLVIDAFEDVVPIVNLAVLPAHLQPDIDKIRSVLSQRGRVFEDLKGCHYKAYTGNYVRAGASQGQSPVQTIQKGRIIIDAAMFQRYNNTMSVLDPLDEPSSANPMDPMANFFDVDDEDGFDLHDAPPGYQAMRHSMVQARHRAARSRLPTKRLSNLSLASGHHVYCTATLQGYCLTTKQWVTFYIDNVEEISWNEEAFDSLILPHDYKRLIRGFVHAQLNMEDTFDDVMVGKGRGIIMLLSGDPGTGKTLTAESVSEVMRKPLYSMGAGELGETADDVEHHLQRVLEISTKWGAVLLLDECDVFLEKRSTKSIQRNKIVSVFLRLLEYYQGVLFLTTNRADSFDPAFESRIHLTIHFPKLDLASRLHIWRTFVRSAKTNSVYASNVGEQEIESLARVDMNGRQIKNVVKTARLLATSEHSCLTMDHIEAVLRVKRGEAGGISERR